MALNWRYCRSSVKKLLHMLGSQEDMVHTPGLVTTWGERKANDRGIGRIAKELGEIRRGCLAGLHLLVESYSRYEWKLRAKQLEKRRSHLIPLPPTYGPWPLPSHCRNSPLGRVQRSQAQPIQFKPQEQRRAEKCVKLKAYWNLQLCSSNSLRLPRKRIPRSTQVNWRKLSIFARIFIILAWKS